MVVKDVQGTDLWIRWVSKWYIMIDELMHKVDVGEVSFFSQELLLHNLCCLPFNVTTQSSSLCPFVGVANCTSLSPPRGGGGGGLCGDGSDGVFGGTAW